jgi:hypothetical protein
MVVRIWTGGSEGFPAGDAEVALVHVSEALQPLNRSWDERDLGHDDIHVDDRLRGKPGTAVLPTCSMDVATPSSAGARRARRSSNIGHAGS